jgi:hypothetical protein
VLLVGVVCLIGLGCESSTPLAPIPDPGGPFQSSVPPETPIDKLTVAQYEELCSKAGGAPYLNDGLVVELTCRQQGLEVAWNLPLDGGSGDGGADGGGSFLSACQADYDNCIQQLSGGATACGIPVYTCTATVELLTACFNEIANSDPAAACLTTPSCAMAVAAGTTTPDAGFIPIGACPNGPPRPACKRLAQQCPGALIDYDPYAY